MISQRIHPNSKLSHPKILLSELALSQLISNVYLVMECQATLWSYSRWLVSLMRLAKSITGKIL